MRAALDTNILAYAEGIDDQTRKEMAQELLALLPPRRTVIPVQALGELYRILTRKGWPAQAAQQAVLAWEDNGILMPTTIDGFILATNFAGRYKLQIWDAVMLAGASMAGCAALLSEDMGHGTTYGGVTVVNPFRPDRHPLLDALLAP